MAFYQNHSKTDFYLASKDCYTYPHLESKNTIFLKENRVLLPLLSLSIALSGLWLLLSGYFETLLLGLGFFSVAIIIWIAHRMGIINHEGQTIQFTFKLILFWPWLIKQIVIANIQVARTIISRNMQLKLSVTKVRSSQKTELGQVVYGNSITLTPGTVTIGIEKDIITVHALTHESAFDLKSGEMDRRISKIEARPDNLDPLLQTIDGEIK
jgi:multicomponent Na+:H+ antiporter subunit E